MSACERNPTLCPVPSMRKCIASMNDLIKVNAHDFSDHVKALIATGSGKEPTPGYLPHSEMMIFLIQVLYTNFDTTPLVCEAAAAGDYNTFKELFAPPPNNASSFIQNGDSAAQIVENTISTPTRKYGNEWPFANYYTLSEVGKSVLLTLVSQDYAFGAYDEDAYVNFLFELNKVRRDSPYAQNE